MAQPAASTKTPRIIPADTPKTPASKRTVAFNTPKKIVTSSADVSAPIIAAALKKPLSAKRAWVMRRWMCRIGYINCVQPVFSSYL